MDQNPNPIRKNGDRNVFCPYYGDCLDHAAKLYWQNWDCSECPHKREKQALSQAPIVKDENALYYLPPQILGEISHWFD